MGCLRQVQIQTFSQDLLTGETVGVTNGCPAEVRVFQFIWNFLWVAGFFSEILVFYLLTPLQKKLLYIVYIIIFILKQQNL